MITKRNLMIAGGLIAAYYVWKKYIKEDESVTVPLEGETSSNASGGDHRIFTGSNDDWCYYQGKVKFRKCNGGCFGNHTQHQKAIQRGECSGASTFQKRTRNSNLGL